MQLDAREGAKYIPPTSRHRSAFLQGVTACRHPELTSNTVPAV